MEVLFTSPSIHKPADNAVPLHRFELGPRVTFVEMMPEFDQWGLVLEGQVGPRENPESASQAVPADGEEETTETPAESDAGAAGASGGPNSSAGNSSSSRGMPPEAEIHEISSGSGD